MIEVRNLTKQYGQRLAINTLNFTVKKGEVVGFLGPNGAGKTTTMKIITGFMAPSSGAVTVGGFDVFENPIEVKRQLGYLPETPPVYTDMVVRDYLEFVGRLKGVPKEKLASSVDQAIAKTNLGDVAKRLIGNLSKGFRQRVGLAQALVGNPDVLILDEPTVGLDPKQVAEIRTLLQDLRGQHTIILSTHILSEVEATCERVIIIDKGQIVTQDTISQLKGTTRTGKVLRLRVKRKESDVRQALEKMEGVLSVKTGGDGLLLNTAGSDELIEKIAEKVVGMGVGLLELSQPTAALEDIFIEMTDRHQNGRA
jgi:ABC-2 type transport system ATP-binding protein